MKIDNSKVTKSLATMKILVDTREQSTPESEERYKSFGVPYMRQKLDFGDYTASCTLPDGINYTLADKCVIERKMTLDELCMCYTSNRARFTREFERAAVTGAKTYLMVEKASWEKAYSGAYRSKFSANALIASITTWIARYNCTLLFCQPLTSGKLIHDILYRELKEHLLNYNPEAKVEEGFDAEKFY